MGEQNKVKIHERELRKDEKNEKNDKNLLFHKIITFYLTLM